MRREVAASHTSLYWTVYQHLIKLGQSFKVSLNYTRRKCWYMQNARVGFKIETLLVGSIFEKHILPISPRREPSLE